MERLIDEIFVSYMNGECSTEQLKHLKAWLEESPEHVAEFNDFRQEHIRLKSALIDEKQLSAAEKRHMLRIAEQEEKHARIVSLRRWAASAVAAVLIMASALVIFSKHFTIIERDDRITAFAPHDSIRTITLPDGTEVWLNNQAMIKYPKKFDKDRRVVELEGEAYFEVAKDKDHPFVVHSQQMDITVLGTTFNVQCFRGSKSANASLMTGVVQVEGNHGEGRIILKPGQRAALDGENGQLTVVQEADTRYDAVWHDKLIPFDNATITQIAAAIEHFYGVNVKIINPKGHNHTYSGVIRQTSSVDSTMRLLKNAMPIEYARKAKDVTITIQ